MGDGVGARSMRLMLSKEREGRDCVYVDRYGKGSDIVNSIQRCKI